MRGSGVEENRRPTVGRRTLCFAVAMAALLSAGLLGMTTSAGAGDDAADQVYVNGRVMLYPDDGSPEQMMSNQLDWAQAVAVTDGVISYVGTNDGADAFVGPDTEVVDLQNKMMMPGLGDGHMHGGPNTDCNMGYEGGTIEDVLGKLKACLLREDQVEHLNSNFVLSADLLQGEGLLPEGTRLDRHILDRLSADPSEDPFGTGTTRPIVVGNMDFHKSYTNTQAIVNAGLDENTPDPPDGFIGRDPDGYPNGQFSDFFADWGPFLPEPPDSAYQRKIADYETSNSLGITTVFHAGGGPGSVALLKRLADDGELTVHVNQGLSAGGIRGVDDQAEIDDLIDDLNATREESDGYSNPASPGEISIDTAKIFCDGVPEFPGQTAAMLEPYRINVGTPENPQWVPGDWRGEEPSCEDARTGFVALDRAKWSIHCHCLGDRATRVTLNNLEAAMDENATWDSRHTLTHLQFIDDRDLDRFGELGVVANFQAQLFQRDAWSVGGIEGYVAPDRMDNLYPAKDLIDGGAVATFGVDWPVTALRPWAALEQGVTREGQVNPAQAIYPGTLNPGNAISLAQSYKASTIGVAYQTHLDDVTGSIEVGKSADMIVVDQDPFLLPGGIQAKLREAKKQLRQAERVLARAEENGNREAIRRARRRVERLEARVEALTARVAEERELAIKRLDQTQVLLTTLAGEAVWSHPESPPDTG